MLLNMDSLEQHLVSYLVVFLGVTELWLNKYEWNAGGSLCFSFFKSSLYNFHMQRKFCFLIGMHVPWFVPALGFAWVSVRSWSWGFFLWGKTSMYTSQLHFSVSKPLTHSWINSERHCRGVHNSMLSSPIYNAQQYALLKMAYKCHPLPQQGRGSSAFQLSRDHSNCYNGETFQICKRVTTNWLQRIPNGNI